MCHSFKLRELLLRFRQSETVILVRSFATLYSGRIVREDENGRSLSIEIQPPNVVRDSRGYSLPRRDVICHISQTIRSSSFDEFDLSNYLDTLTPTLTSSEVSEILKSIKSPSKALEFFRFSSIKIPGFKHDCFTYNRIFTIVSKSLETINEMNQILDEMEKSGVQGNISTVNILIGIFGGCEEKLQRCLQLADKWELKLNRYSYKCLLQAHLRSRNISRAFRVYQEMRRKGYALDVFAYNMLLDALAKNDKVEQAYKVFTEMKHVHCEPDEYTYTILIRMTGKLGKSEEFIYLFQDMIKKGRKPNLIGYNTMIQALAKNRMIDKSIFLFSQMVENNCQPNEFTYSVLLDALISEGQLIRLDEVVQISRKYMNKSIYSYLIKQLSKLGHVCEAHSLFCNMWSFHDGGDRNAYLSMLESLCNASKTGEALDLLSKIHEKGLTPDTFMYNMVLNALSKVRCISEIRKLYEQMKHDGPLPDIFTYNILISSFGKEGLINDSIQIFDEMYNTDCKPDVITYNSLINCLGKNGDLDEAHMRFKEMQERGLTPDVITYTTLIECFGKSNHVEMACMLFSEMLREGCYPNIVTYNILLDCLEKCGKIEEALNLYAKLKEQGLTPDSITYSVLERLQSGSHKPVRVRKQNPIKGWVVTPLG